MITRQVRDETRERALYQFAWARYQGGRHAEAIEALARLLESDPLDLRANLLMGRSLVASGQLERAMSLYGTITRLIPRLKEPWWALAWALVRRGRLKEAAGCMLRFVRVHGESASARRMLARLRVGLGAPARAAAELERAGRGTTLAQSRSDAALMMAIARMHRLAGEMDQAVEAYLKAADLDPTLPGAFRELAHIHREAGEVRRARIAALELTRLTPGDPEALLLAGEVCAESEDWDRCVALLERYLAFCPRDGDARAMKARAHLKLGELGDAQNEYTHVLELAPGSQEAAWTLARLARHFQDPGLERAHLHRVLLRDPAHCDALRALAELEMHSGRYRAAHRTLSRLLLLLPGSSAILFRLGQVSYRLGDLPAARAALERVVRLRPHDHLAQFEFARVLLAGGQPGPARERLRQVIELAPASAEARIARHELEALSGRDLLRPALLLRRAA